jgi:hypothetical protein
MKRRAIRRRPGLAALGVLLGVASVTGCMYRFSGGGLPTDIRTAAVIPFENETPTRRAATAQAVRCAVSPRPGTALRSC